MNAWSRSPVLRLLFSFVAGTLCCFFFSPTIHSVFFFLCIGWVLLLTLSISKRVILSFSLQWLIGCLIVLLFFLLGVYLTYQASQKNSIDYFGLRRDHVNTLLVKITEAPIAKLKSQRAIAEVKAIKTKNIWRTCRGKLLIYFPNDSCTEKIAYGDFVMLKSVLSPIPAAKNPGGFDYRKYLSCKDIALQTRVDKYNWLATGKNEGNVIVECAYRVRDYLLKQMSLHGISKNAYAVGAALIYGYEDALNTDLFKSYSASGALHVLSVSGLHVAIVLLVLNKLLSFLLRYNQGKILRAILLFLLLWFYALLTGFSASVLRSAAMFTFIIFSDASNKSSSIHNTIGASMFILLLWNPLLLMDVGFQLSYLALMGIVLWQPILQVLWNPDNKLFKHIWSIVSVSIAAQLATFPLAFFYFHQFPVYFLWANLIIIPVSSLILYLGMLASFLCFNFTLSSPFYFLLDIFLKFLNASTVFFQKLPYSLLEGISWSVAEIFLLYAAFFLTSKFFQSHKIIFLKISLLCFFCTMLLWIQDFLAITQQKMLIVYCVNKHSAIDFIEGERNCLLADESLLASPEKINQNIRPNWWKLHLKETSIYPIHCLMKTNRIGDIRIHNSIIEFRSKKILLLNRHSVHYRPCVLKEKIDWLVLSDNAASSIKSLFEKFHFELIIFDASNDPSYTKQCIQECLQLRLPYYSICEKGAFVTRVE